MKTVTITSHKKSVDSIAGEITINIPEQDERVTVELHRGSHTDEDGIVHGGDWIGPVEGFFKFNLDEDVDRDEFDFIPHGYICDAQGKHIQSVSAEIGARGFPYRNMQISRRVL